VADLYGVATAQASEQTEQYYFKPLGVTPLSKLVMPNWEVSNKTYTEWENEGDVYNCSAWTPPENVVNLDEEFTQSRECSQKQSRYRTHKKWSERLKKERKEGPFYESRVINIEETQDSVGTRDYITGERADAYPNWSKVGGFYGCGDWSPDPSEVNYGATFTQSRDCSWDEDRQRDVFDTWQSGRETYSRTDSEERTVPYADSRESTGTYRDWQPTSSTYTVWGDVDADYGHGSWSPAPSTQPSDFIQSREYKRDQERYEQKREQDQVTEDYRNVGSPVLHNQTVDRSEDRNVAVNYTLWEEIERSDYTPWSPAPSSQTTSFTQTRNYAFTEERERFYTTAGEGELLRVTERSEPVEQSESRPVTVAYTPWTETGENYDCSTWSPARDSVGVGESYMQARSCKQDEIRDRVYTNESTELNRVEESRILTPIQTREQTGEGSWEKHPSAFSDWENEGSRYEYTPWTPASSEQKSDFSQSRGFKQNETRYEQGRERDVHSGTIRDEGEPIKHDRTVAGQESRSVVVNLGSWSNTARSSETSWSPAASTQTSDFTQSMGYTQHQTRTVVHNAPSEVHRFTDSQALANQTDTRAVSVSFGAWENSGAIKDCGGWSPAENTVAYNESYTQTRECDQGQVRDRVYKADGNALKTFVESRTVKVNDTQNATGTGNWVAHASTFTSWVDDGGRHTYSAYTPAPANQTSNYTQSRSYKQNQARNEQKRERDTIGGSIRNVGSPIPRSQTIDGSESRTVSVTASDWANGATSGHSAWSPAPTTQTSNYTRSRTYNQAQSRVWTHKVGTSSIHTRNESRTLSNQTQSQTVVVSWTSWVNNGAMVSCGDWTPAPNTVAYNQSYTQTRSCQQPQKRDRVYKVGSTTIGSAAETRNTSASQTQNATGTGNWVAHTSTFTSWVNEGAGYAYGSYSPEATNQTSNFWQSRSYKQNQTRNEQKRERDTIGGSVRNVGAPIARSKTVDSEDARLVTVTRGYWEVVGDAISCTEPSPAFGEQKSSYTQSQTCDYNEERVYSYSVGGEYVEKQVTPKYGSWSVSVSGVAGSKYEEFDHGAWSPSIDESWYSFNQFQSYSAHQYSKYTHKIGGEIVFENEFITHTYEGDRTKKRWLDVTTPDGWVDDESRERVCGEWNEQYNIRDCTQPT
jgi:hypothetical protein